MSHVGLNILKVKTKYEWKSFYLKETIEVKEGVEKDDNNYMDNTVWVVVWQH